MANRRGSASHPISAPSFESTHIHRPRLVEALLSAGGKRLALIVASAGYGKTTLLSDYTRLATGPTCWVRLSETDRDLLTLAGQVWASIERRFYRVKGDVEVHQLEGLAPGALARRMAAALEAKVPESLSLVIEDLHLLEGEGPALRLVQGLIEELPENAFLLVSSRRVPELDLVDLIARDRLLTIGAEELAFDREELRELVSARLGEEPPEDLLTALMNETGGWVTGVLLSNRLLNPNALPINGRLEPLSFDYLAENALGRVSEELQDFMLRTSILPYMTAEICDELMEREGSQGMLEELVQRGLFTSVTLNDPKTYEYHHALAQFLRARAERQIAEAERNGLSYRAAKILEREGQEYLAVKLLLEAGFEDEAVEVADRYSLSLFEANRASDLRRTGELFVSRQVDAPSIFIRLANSLEKEDYEAESRAWLRLAEGSRKRLDQPTRWYLETSRALLTASAGDVKGLEKSLRVLDSLGDPPTSRAISAHARAMSNYWSMKGRHEMGLVTLIRARQEIASALDRVGDNEESQRMIEDSVSAVNTALAAQYAAVGRMDLAVEASRAALEWSDPASQRSKVIRLNNLACSLHNTGRYEEAEKTYLEGMSLAGDLENDYGAAFCHCGYGELLLDLGRFDEALTHLRESYEYATSSGALLLQSHIEGHLRLLGYRCPRLTKHVPPIPDGTPSARQIKVNGGVFLSFVLAADLRDEPKKVLAYLDQLNSEVRMNDLERITLELWRAILCVRLGTETAAQVAMRSAISHASEKANFHPIASYLHHETDDRRKLLLGAISDRPGFERVEKLMDQLSRHARVQAQLPVPGQVLQALVRLELLGQGRVTIDGTEAKLRPQHFSILAYLAMHGHRSRDKLIETFWPGAEPRVASTRLHTAAYEIRKEIGKSSLLSRGGIYRLDDEGLEIDGTRFQKMARRALDKSVGRVEREILIEEALRLYRGPLLPAFYDSWVVELRLRLEVLYLELLEMRAQQYLQEDRAAQALKDLSDVLDTDPLRDQTNVLFLKALGMLGRSGEAIRHFHRLRAMYRRELGLELPSALLQEFRSLAG